MGGLSSIATVNRSVRRSVTSPFVGILLDSSVVIAAERKGQNPRALIDHLRASYGDTEATISIITVVELAHGIARADSTVRQIAREHFLHELLSEISVEPITLSIALRPGKIDGLFFSAVQ